MYTQKPAKFERKLFENFSSIGFDIKIFGELQSNHLYSEILSPNAGIETFPI